MLLLGVFLFLIPALSFGTGYGWNGYPYGYNYGNQPYANYGYNYGNQLYPSYYSQPQSFGSNSNFGSISRGFQKYIYPVYYQLPSLGRLLKSGAYGALKGAGVGAAIGGIAGVIG